MCVLFCFFEMDTDTPSLLVHFFFFHCARMLCCEMPGPIRHGDARRYCTVHKSLVSLLLFLF